MGQDCACIGVGAENPALRTWKKKTATPVSRGPGFKISHLFHWDLFEWLIQEEASSSMLWQTMLAVMQATAGGNLFFLAQVAN